MYLWITTALLILLLVKIYLYIQQALFKSLLHTSNQGGIPK